MKTLLCTGLLVLTVLLVHILPTVTATGIFCQAPPVFVGDPANLTCHFPQDLSESRKGIVVVRRDSIPGSSDEVLFGCVWGNGKLQCGDHDGYRPITQQPTYDVTFQIPSHEPGTFHCDYIPSNTTVTVESCNFTLKGSPPTTATPSRSDPPTDTTERSQGRSEDGATGIFCQAPPVFEGDPATLTCHYPQDLSQSRKNIIVARRDSIPGSQYEFILGCAWRKKNLVCGVHDKIKILTPQPMYDVTFQIASRQPGTFRCHITPEDEAVTVQSCDFTLKGNGSSRDTTERSQRRNEDGDRLHVTIMVTMVTVPSVIAAVAMTLTVVLCRRRSCGSGSYLVQIHWKGKSKPEFATKEIQSCGSASPLIRKCCNGESQTELAMKQIHCRSCGSASPLIQKYCNGESQTELAMNEIQSCGSASSLIQRHCNGESQTHLAMKEIQPAGNVLVGEPKSTKGNAKCK